MRNSGAALISTPGPNTLELGTAPLLSKVANQHRPFRLSLSRFERNSDKNRTRCLQRIFNKRKGYARAQVSLELFTQENENFSFFSRHYPYFRTEHPYQARPRQSQRKDTSWVSTRSVKYNGKSTISILISRIHPNRFCGWRRHRVRLGCGRG